MSVYKFPLLIGERMYRFTDKNSRKTVTIELTSEQEQKLKKTTELDLADVGFFHPDQVISYQCESCDDGCDGYFMDEKPRIDVYIRLESLGKVMPVANLFYKCKRCTNVFHIGIELEGIDKIPAEFIVLDATGDYKKPTPKSIEELLATAEKRATEAFLDKDSIETCRHWAEKIGYKLDEERIKQLDVTQRQAYLRSYEKNLPAHIEEIRKDSYAFKLGASAGDEECSMFEGTGLAEQVDKLLENLPHINLPEDKKLRGSILKILFQYRKMYDNAIEQTITEKAEMEKKFNDDIQSCQNVSRKTTHLITQYCEKAGIDKETLDKIADEATIPFPGDEVEDEPDMPF